MDFPFTLPGFETKGLAVRIAGVLKTPILFADGVAQRPAKRTTYMVKDDTGRVRRITLKATLFDAVPAVQIDDEKAQAIVPRLAWYEYAWLGIPFALIAAGGRSAASSERWGLQRTRVCSEPEREHSRGTG